MSSELVQKYLIKAQSFLEAAKVLSERGLCDRVALQTYYSMSWAMKALLLTKGVTPEELSRISHGGLIMRFFQEFLKTGELLKVLGKWVSNAYDLRRRSDYTIAQITQEQVSECLQNAAQFLDQARSWVLRKLRE